MDGGTKKILFDTPETSSTFLVPCSAGCGTLVDLNHTSEHYGELCARLQTRNQSPDSSPKHAIPAERMFRITLEMQFKKQFLSNQEKRRLGSNGRGSPLGSLPPSIQPGDENTAGGSNKGKRKSRGSRNLPMKPAPSKRSRPTTLAIEVTALESCIKKEDLGPVIPEVTEIRATSSKRRKNDPIPDYANGFDPPLDKETPEVVAVSPLEMKKEAIVTQELRTTSSLAPAPPPPSSRCITPPPISSKAPVTLSQSQLLYQRQQICLRALRAMESLQYERRLHAAAVYKQQLLASRESVLNKTAPPCDAEASQTKDTFVTSNALSVTTKDKPTSQSLPFDKSVESKPLQSAPPVMSSTRLISDLNSFSRMIPVQSSKQNDFVSNKPLSNVVTTIAGGAMSGFASKHSTMPLPSGISQSYPSSTLRPSMPQSRSRFVSPSPVAVDAGQRYCAPTTDALERRNEQSLCVNNTPGYSLSSLEPLYEMEALSIPENAKVQDSLPNASVLTALLTKSDGISHLQSAPSTISSTIAPRPITTVTYHSDPSSLLLSPPGTAIPASMRSSMLPPSRHSNTTIYSQQVLSSTPPPPPALGPVVPQLLARRGFVGRVGQRVPSLPPQLSQPQPFPLSTSTVRIIPSVSSFPPTLTMPSTTATLNKSTLPMAVIRNNKTDDLTNPLSRPNPSPTRYSGVVHSSSATAQLHCQGPT